MINTINNSIVDKCMVKKMSTDVKDKIAEVGINLSVIIQGLILAVILKFGTYMTEGIDTLNKEMAQLNTTIILNKSEIGYLNKTIMEVRQSLKDHENKHHHQSK